MIGYVGIDIGGTNVVCGIVSENGDVLGMAKLATEAQGGFQHVTSRVAEAVRQLMATVPEVSCAAVGVGVPGFVDHERGIAVKAVNLGWDNIPLADELSRHLGLPVYINNDVRMYIYGEAVAGAGKNHRYVLGITLGTGIAAASVFNGELHYGSGFRAGELGHFGMPGIPYKCVCGLTGCLETIACANGIARQAREALAEGEPSVLGEWFSADTSGLTAADVTRAYDAGDPLAQRIMSHTGTMLARGLAPAISLTSPDVLVIGGGAAKAGDRLFGPMREELERTVHPMYMEGLTISVAHRLEDAGVVGSALYARSRV
ncbi:ROK family protein [Paenibacillus thalictri]|uniref:ROK family protein n=1 Tax=Paenibacillus thalictri TaxID=2527873 RepID=A0A4Q9E0P6_9BACL|nr:ROK family protein [Paenibacillus thalictri]TBL81713.1 ROK family protein [Paenibacillus thalictri]